LASWLTVTMPPSPLSDNSTMIPFIVLCQNTQNRSPLWIQPP
jgi:hypothetical protein